MDQNNNDSSNSNGNGNKKETKKFIKFLLRSGNKNHGFVVVVVLVVVLVGVYYSGLVGGAFDLPWDLKKTTTKEPNVPRVASSG